MGDTRKPDAGLTFDEITRLPAWRVEQLARLQLSGTRYGAESDALTALHLIIALARQVQQLQEPLS